MTTSGSILVCSKSYVFDPRPRFPFRIVAKQYWIGELYADVNDHDSFSKTREDVRTLVFVHGGAGHKEHWEPTIQRLFENQGQQAGSGMVRFRDMWSLDMPNHGDSAILNEEVLRWGYDAVFSWEDHARGVHTFLAGLGTGVDVDFSKRRLALVGHSMGGPVAILASTYHPLLKICSLHLIEPSLLGEKLVGQESNFPELTAKQQDIWPSREEALRALRTKPRYREWDERVLKIYVTHGLRPLPTAEYPDKKEGVTLKCTRKQQTAVVRDHRSIGIAYRYLPHALKEIPTHIVYGEIRYSEVMYEFQQDSLYAASGGISNFASVTTIPGVGHTMVQTHPDVVGDVIWRQLSQSNVSSHCISGTVATKL